MSSWPDRTQTTAPPIPPCEEQHLADRSVGIGELVAGVSESPDLVVSQNPRAWPLLADQRLGGDVVARRRDDPVPATGRGRPFVEAAHRRQKRMCHIRRVCLYLIDHLADIVSGDVSDGAFAPTGNERLAKMQLGVSPAPLSR